MAELVSPLQYSNSLNLLIIFISNISQGKLAYSCGNVNINVLCRCWIKSLDGIKKQMHHSYIIVQFKNVKEQSNLNKLIDKYYNYMQMESCDCGKKIDRLCISQKCEHSAEFCADQSCIAFIRHKRCPSIMYSECINVENEVEKSERQFLRKVNLIVYELAEEIKLSLNQQVQRKHYRKLGKSIKKLRKDGRFRQRKVIGRQIKQAWDEASNFENETMQVYEKAFQQFRDAMQNIRNKILEQKAKALEKINFGQSQPSEIVNEQENVESSSPAQAQLNSTSTRIVSEQQKWFQIHRQARARPRPQPTMQSEDQKEEFLSLQNKTMIQQSFNGAKVKSMHKIFTASARENMIEGKRSPQQLFKKCGQLKNPLIVVKYIYKPFNEVFLFGAWTPLSYGSGQTQFKHDSTYSSRIFWFDQNLIFPLKKQQKENNCALYTKIDFGLIFGRDLDIKCEGTRTNRITIGILYQTSHLSSEQKKKLEVCQEKMSFIYKGEILDYQVYQVEFEAQNVM